jgi:tetratricopeptide (TPR) repeat protein
VVVIALVGAVAVAIPLLGASSLRASQAAASDGRLADALALARGSLRVQPYSAPAHLQQALVLEQLGDIPGAARAARTATSEEPDNWQTWLTVSRLAAEEGRLDASIAAYRRARALNPRSPIFRRLGR